MRTDDIVMGGRILAHMRTPEIYLPASVLMPMPVAEMTVEQLRRGLCQKSRGDVKVCVTCPGGCRWGLELVRRGEHEC